MQISPCKSTNTMCIYVGVGAISHSSTIIFSLPNIFFLSQFSFCVSPYSYYPASIHIYIPSLRFQHCSLLSLYSLTDISHSPQHVSKNGKDDFWKSGILRARQTAGRDHRPHRTTGTMISFSFSLRDTYARILTSFIPPARSKRLHQPSLRMQRLPSRPFLQFPTRPTHKIRRMALAQGTGCREA